MSNAELAAGTTLEYYNGAAWVAVSEPKSIGDIGESAAFVDATHLSSPNQTKEYITGMKDTSEIAIAHAFVAGNAGDVALRARATSRLTTSFRIVFPTTPNVTASFAAVLGGWKMGSPTSETPLEATVTGRISGAVTWT